LKNEIPIGPRHAAAEQPLAAGNDPMVVTSDDFKPPRRVSQDDLDAIRVTFKIDRDKIGALRRRLDEIVDAFAVSIRDERLRPDRQGDRDRLSRTRTAIKKARAALPSRTGDTAKHPLEMAGAIILGPVVSVDWLAEKFPDFQTLLRATMDMKTGGINLADIQRRRRACDEFASRQTVPLVSALLEEIERSLTMAIRLFPLMPGGKGGRKALIQRKYMIANLAKGWRDLGRIPRSGPNSQFTAFCEAVFEAIGWPTEGAVAAIPDALSILRHHPERIMG
jgi:hypothetical protein